MKLIRHFVNASLVSTALIASSALAASVDVALKITPTGQVFHAKGSQVKGAITKNADGSISSDKIEIPLSQLKTGMGLRDDHMKNKHLEVSKFPNAIITNAKGKDGKGTAELEVRGKKKAVSGTYEIQGSNVLVKFPINISDYDVGKVRYMGMGVKDEAQVEALIPLK